MSKETTIVTLLGVFSFLFVGICYQFLGEAVRFSVIGTLFSWGTTALGASAIFFDGCYRIPPRFMDFTYGLSAGIMMAASYFSLLAPALVASKDIHPKWFPAFLGLMVGSSFVRFVDWLLPESTVQAFLGAPSKEGDSPSSSASFSHSHSPSSTIHSDDHDRSSHRPLLLVIAMTVHNIPEGIALGVAYAAAYQLGTREAFDSAVLLNIALAIQNLPEGLSVSVPLKHKGMSPWRAFFYGQLSGAVEVVGGVLGASAVLLMQSILPYALSFAAGAMIYVVVHELLPDAHSSGNSDMVTSGFMIGFIVMMTLDIAFE